MDLAVSEYIRKLDNIFKLANKIDKDDDELRAHMAKYLCIRISGLLETFFKKQIANYLNGATPKAVENYVNNQFKQFTSVNSNKISKTLSLFSEDWATKFNENISEQQKAALDAIVANRHDLAHGKDPGITLNRIENYYRDIKDVIALLELIIV